ncbi:MAG TPA: regulatory protein RecX [Chitinophagaceae bacterium]|nr:regulatory protein RecX [Chitinophagaceae bacterium]
MLQRKQLSKEQALQKLRHFCSYQERCHQEVKEKLYSFQLRKDVVEESISQLIEEDYLNEERFAVQFAGGKFRMKQWGRVRIMHALKEKRVSQYCINQALKQIDEEAYRETLHKLADKKWNSLASETQLMIRLNKTKMYLLQKGFEPDQVNAVLKNITLEKN